MFSKSDAKHITILVERHGTCSGHRQLTCSGIKTSAKELESIIHYNQEKIIIIA